MIKIVSRLSWALVAAACLFLNSGPAQALNTKSWVSGTGSDAAACTRTAPCLTFNRAFSQTSAGGTINCLDPGDFGPLNIDRAITIDCTGTFASVVVTLDGITIQNAGASDIVRLRGLSIEHAGGNNSGISMNATLVGALHIEQCKIFGFLNGVFFQVPDGASSELYISDSVISENAASNGAGVVVSAQGTATVRVSLNNVKLNNNRNGLIVQSRPGSTGRISLSMSDSTAAGNTDNGIQVVAQGAPVVVALDNVITTANSTGLEVDGAATRVLITRLTAISNFIGMSTVNSGVVVSYGDNHINNNVSVNGTPTVVQTPQ